MKLRNQSCQLILGHCRCLVKWNLYQPLFVVCVMLGDANFGSLYVIYIYWRKVGLGFAVHISESIHVIVYSPSKTET